MDNAILEVVLGLLLIYITLAILVMKVQETIAGRWLRRRVSTLNALLDEALGHSDDLKKKLFANPLIFALSPGTSPASEGKLRDSGPSNIPPDLFARALLIELNNDGQHGHPAERYATPTAFVADKASAPGASTEKVWGSLRGLLAANEASWAGFEAAIARWFAAIGDRSDGWYQRESQKWSLRLSLLLAILLNVDSFYIAEQLSISPDLRRTLASLAETVNARFAQDVAANGATGAVSGSPNAVVRPEVRVSAGMADAITRLNYAYFNDKSIASFLFDQINLTKTTAKTEEKVACAGMMEAPAKNEHPYYLSNPRTWLVVLPRLLSSIEDQQVGKHADSVVETLREDYRCLSAVSSWVRSAITASADAGVQKTMREAAVALESAKSGLLELIENKRPTQTMQALFLADPEVFTACANAPGASRSSVQQCVARSALGQVRLPLGPFASNLRQQFCRPIELAAQDKVPDAPWWCTADSFKGSQALGIPQLALVSKGFPVYLFWFLGCVVTAFFVALGAPFWFDVLGKVVNLRAAGRDRDSNDEQLRGQGSAPLAAPAASPASAAEPAAGRGSPAPFSLARNDFEDQLVSRDIIAVQQQLGVAASGVLDAPTRAAIAGFTREQGLEASDELSFMVFERLVRRNPVNVPVARPGGRLLLGEVHELVQPLAHNLMALLDFKQRIAGSETRFSADLRALSVLYRYKKEAPRAVHERAVFEQALHNPAALDEIDPALLSEILSFTGSRPSLPREPAPWLDWAIGELGQREKNCTQREGSNPRIIEYLDSAEANGGNGGDHTPWCAAFVAWTLNSHNALPGKGRVVAAPPQKETRLAASWGAPWGQEVASIKDALPGDVVTFILDPGKGVHHVGFLLEVDPQGNLWVLGGNQAVEGVCCLEPFQEHTVAAIRRP